MNCLFFNAFADTSNLSQGNPYSLLIILIIFALVFYFMIFRPQQKKNKTHKELLNTISKGDEVLTAGGLIGRVVKVTKTDYISIAFNDTLNEVFIKRDCVISILPKGTMKSFNCCVF